MLKKINNNIINIITSSKHNHINTINDYINSFKEFSEKIINYFDIDNLDKIFSIQDGIILVLYNIVHGLKNNKYLNKIIQFFHDCKLPVVFLFKMNITIMIF